MDSAEMRQIWNSLIRAGFEMEFMAFFRRNHNRVSRENWADFFYQIGEAAGAGGEVGQEGHLDNRIAGWLGVDAFEEALGEPLDRDRARFRNLRREWDASFIAEIVQEVAADADQVANVDGRLENQPVMVVNQDIEPVQILEANAANLDCVLDNHHVMVVDQDLEPVQILEGNGANLNCRLVNEPVILVHQDLEPIRAANPANIAMAEQEDGEDTESVHSEETSTEGSEKNDSDEDEDDNEQESRDWREFLINLRENEDMAVDANAAEQRQARINRRERRSQFQPLAAPIIEPTRRPVGVRGIRQGGREIRRRGQGVRGRVGRPLLYGDARPRAMEQEDSGLFACPRCHNTYTTRQNCNRHYDAKHAGNDV